MQQNLLNSITNKLNTKNIDMKQRRIVNSAPSQDTSDGVVRSELDAATKNSQQYTDNAIKTVSFFPNPITFLNKVIFNMGVVFNAAVTYAGTVIFSKLVTFSAGLATNLIQPLSDSTTAILFTKANGTTKIFVIDSTNKAIVLENAVIIKTKNVAGTIENLLTHFSDDIVYLDNPDGNINFRPTSQIGVNGSYGEVGPITLTYVTGLSGTVPIGLTVTTKTVTFNGGLETGHT